MSNRPIRMMMLYLIGGILAAAVLFYGVTAVSNYQTLQEFNRIVESQLNYDSYQSRLDALQDAVTACFNDSGEAAPEEIETLSAEFACYSRQLTADFSHPQFVDNSYIVQNYLEKVQEFLDYGYEAGFPGGFSEYNETMNWYRNALESYETTLSVAISLTTERLNESTKNWYQKERIMLVLYILICLAAFYIGRKAVNWLVRPITALTERANRIIAQEYGNPGGQQEFRDSCRETAVLAEAFERMTETILSQMEELKNKMEVSQRLHDLEMENMKTKVALNQSEMCLMQSLTSPHFLFNCLSTISSLALIEGAAQTEQYSIQLAGFLRTFLDRIGRTVTVSEEIDHIREYIEIQKLRFGRRIAFEIACDPSCESRKIPAIILQPLVENALAHGLKDCRRGGLIQVRVSLDGKGTIIEVQDNGTGIPEEKIRQIESNVKRPFEPGEKEIGLRSVIWRADYFAEGKASLFLKNLKQGLCVIVRIPSPDDS